MRDPRGLIEALSLSLSLMNIFLTTDTEISEIDQSGVVRVCVCVCFSLYYRHIIFPRDIFISRANKRAQTKTDGYLAVYSRCADSRESETQSERYATPSLPPPFLAPPPRSRAIPRPRDLCCLIEIEWEDSRCCVRMCIYVSQVTLQGTANEVRQVERCRRAGDSAPILLS